MNAGVPEGLGGEGHLPKRTGCFEGSAEGGSKLDRRMDRAIVTQHYW